MSKIENKPLLSQDQFELCDKYFNQMWQEAQSIISETTPAREDLIPLVAFYFVEGRISEWENSEPKAAMLKYIATIWSQDFNEYKEKEARNE